VHPVDIDPVRHLAALSGNIHACARGIALPTNMCEKLAPITMQSAARVPHFTADVQPPLADPTLRPGSGLRHALVCLPLRLGAGTALAVWGQHLDLAGVRALAVVFLILAIAFASTAAGGAPGGPARARSWKNYPRAAAMLLSASAACWAGRADVAGIILAADSLVSFQARHAAIRTGP